MAKSNIPQAPHDDKKFITCPHKGPGWPNWPWLPVKRHGQDGLECGLLLDENLLGDPVDPNHPCFRTIILANLFNLKETYKTAERKVYASVDEMLADGWQVD